MRVTALSGYRELLYAALIIFSAVSLATLEFLKNAVVTTDALEFPKTTVVYMVVLVQVLPALVLLGADRLIAARYGAGRRLRVFRSVLFVVAVVLIVRQLQLYWGPAEDFTDSVSSSFVRLVLVDLIFLAAVVGLAIWLFRGLAWFFVYMSPVAIVMTVLIPFQVPTGGGLPETFAQEVETATHSESQPAVFILVFDELGYDVLFEEGKVDAESFPNIAALAGDGVWFTNATTNNFRSVAALSTIIDPVKSLAQDFDIRLYSQFLRVEQRYVDDCGKVMTCRGVGYLTENNQLRLAGNLALRAFYQATPKAVDTAIDRPMGWLLDRLGWAYPSVDFNFFQTLTKRQFSVFLDDIDSQESPGRIHLLHLLLPHTPFAFNGEGTALSTASPFAPSPTSPAGSPSVERYRQQSMFVDVLVGKFISKLKSEGIYDESVIVLTGDHGPRAHLPSPEKPPDAFLPHVPLVIHAPGLNGRASDVDYQHMDFGPTLTDILGLPLPKDAEGVSAFSEERPQRDKVIHVDFNTFVYSEEDDSWHFRPSDTGAATDDERPMVSDQEAIDPSDTGAATDDEQPAASDQEAIDRSDTGAATDWDEQLTASDQEAIETLARRSIEFLPAGKWPSLYDSLTGEFQQRCPRELFDQAGVEAAAQLGDDLRLLRFERLESVTIEDSSAQAVITGEIVGQGEYQIQAVFQKEARDWKIAPAPDTQGCDPFGRRLL